MNSGFITQMKDKNGDMWYHQIVIDTITENKDKMYTKLSLYSNELEDRIDKAIDKLNNMKDTYYESNMANDMQNIFDLLDILEGVDKK